MCGPYRSLIIQIWDKCKTKAAMGGLWPHWRLLPLCFNSPLSSLCWSLWLSACYEASDLRPDRSRVKPLERTRNDHHASPQGCCRNRQERGRTTRLFTALRRGTWLCSQKGINISVWQRQLEKTDNFNLMRIIWRAGQKTDVKDSGYWYRYFVELLYTYPSQHFRTLNDTNWGFLNMWGRIFLTQTITKCFLLFATGWINKLDFYEGPKRQRRRPFSPCKCSKLSSLV